ncbi:MAG: hypothetical protein ACKO9W_03600, partial [Bacteroidota bacterium]
MDVTTRDGNQKQLSGKLGVSPFLSRLVLEGPLWKPKSPQQLAPTFIFSAKGSYLIRNHFDKPIREIPVTIGRHIQNVSWMIDEKPFQPEDRSGLL